MTDIFGTLWNVFTQGQAAIAPVVAAPVEAAKPVIQAPSFWATWSWILYIPGVIGCAIIFFNEMKILRRRRYY